MDLLQIKKEFWKCIFLELVLVFTDRLGLQNCGGVQSIFEQNVSPYPSLSPHQVTYPKGWDIVVGVGE